MEPPVFVGLVFWVIVGALVGAAIGRARGQEFAGAFLGGVLGPIGWIFAAIGTDERSKCPECGGSLKKGVRKCIHCGSDVSAVFATTPPAPVTAPAPATQQDPKCACAHCGTNIAFPLQMAGQQIACPSCGQQTTLVQASNVT